MKKEILCFDALISFALGVICKLKHFLPEKATTSNLHLKKLQVLQNKCLRIIEGWRVKQNLLQSQGRR